MQKSFCSPCGVVLPVLKPTNKFDPRLVYEQLRSDLLYRRLLVVVAIAVNAFAPFGLAQAGQWPPSAPASQSASLTPVRTPVGKITPTVQTCGDALTRAEQRYVTPKGLLMAIATVETGRKDTRTGVVTPWPWSANADNISYYFATRAEAVAWVQDQQAHGTASIDVGCMQVNLLYHPQAFGSVDEAFDPVHNADYAARFLVHLCAETGSWEQAIGFYHSRTTDLATGYRRQVAAAFTQSVTIVRDALLARLRLAWSATLPATARLQESKASTTNLAAVDHHELTPATSNDMPAHRGTCWKSGSLLALTTFGQGG